MAKNINEQRLAIIIELTRDGGTAPVDVSVRADYEVEAEGLMENRSANVVLNQAQEKAIKSFGAQVLVQIKQLEG